MKKIFLSSLLAVSCLTFAEKPAAPSSDVKKTKSGPSVVEPQKKTMETAPQAAETAPVESAPTEAAAPAQSAPVAEESSSALKRSHIFGVGLAYPTKTFVLKSSLAVAYDFFMPLSADVSLRAGLWGFTSSQEEAGTKYTYTLLNVDLGADYWILNGDFKLAIGGRLGYAIPIVTIKLSNGTELPFSGESSITPALSLSTYYKFSSFMVGIESRAAFYSETKTGVPAHISAMLSFGKEF
ncbi:MAG: hypothetical protein EB120_11250 [Proteobacteria bacterium]|nr:hypothetical protein [Pseudomonadota bacterium]NDG27735.1 hypothetical protein [Pseudomonadota bacterium]